MRAAAAILVLLTAAVCEWVGIAAEVREPHPINGFSLFLPVVAIPIACAALLNATSKATAPTLGRRALNTGVACALAAMFFAANFIYLHWLFVLHLGMWDEGQFVLFQGPYVGFLGLPTIVLAAAMQWAPPYKSAARPAISTRQ
jgi:hypothetical protein